MREVPSAAYNDEQDRRSVGPRPPGRGLSTALWALISGGVTLGVPLLWALFTSVTKGDASLAIGWMGLMLVLLIVPGGIVITLVLTVCAIVQSRKRKKGVPP